MEVYAIAIILVSLVVLICNCTNKSEGMYAKKDPLSEFLSLPNNISEHNIIASQPRFMPPTTYAEPTDYTYNSHDDAKPMMYVYNTPLSDCSGCKSWMTGEFFTNKSDHLLNRFPASTYNVGVMDHGMHHGMDRGMDNINGFMPRPEQYTKEQHGIFAGNMNFSRHPKLRLPTKPNPLYTILEKMPVGPGWKY
jgi:hypothetical protein